jgi:hypothetical protein
MAVLRTEGDFILDDLHVANVAEAASAALSDALNHWIKEHAKGIDRADLLAEHLKQYTLQIKASNSAATTVTVELEAVKPGDDEAFIYQIISTGGKKILSCKLPKG